MAEHHGASMSSTTTVQQQQQDRGSRATTTTTRPKIKIIHIVAPEVIKTDVANFRDLVQRLTGKPTANAGSVNDDASPPVEEDKEITVAKKRRPAAVAPVLMAAERSGFLEQQEPCKKVKMIKCEVEVKEGGGGFGDYGSLDCNDLWVDLNPGGFLSFLEEELNAFQGLAAVDHDFLPLPLGGGSARMDLVGEMYAS